VTVLGFDETAWLAGKEVSRTVPGIGPVTYSKDAPMPSRFSELHRRDERQRFWLRESVGWPDDAYWQVFLGNALNVVGRAMFGEAWTGYESSVDMLLKPLPLIPGFASRSERLHASSMVSVIEGNKKRPPSFDGDLVEYGPWREARELRAENLQQLQPIRDRLREVKSAIHASLRDGELEYYLLPLLGGVFEQGAAKENWNAAAGVVEQRFYMCQMHPAKPFQIGVTGGGYNWIFVSLPSLQRCVDRVRENKISVSQATRKGGARSRKDIAVEAACRDWLIQVMESDPDKRGNDDRPAPLKGELLAQAKVKWSGLSDRAFHRAYSSAIDAGNGRFIAWTNQYL
jgi:hypothetical protein